MTTGDGAIIHGYLMIFMGMAGMVFTTLEDGTEDGDGIEVLAMELGATIMDGEASMILSIVLLFMEIVFTDTIIMHTDMEDVDTTIIIETEVSILEQL